MQKTIVLASKNKHKIQEIRDMLSGFEILSLDDIGFDEEIDETGETFVENATIKVRAIEAFCKNHDINCCILADDSGLCVDRLGGAPGVHSARFGGNHDNESNRARLLRELAGETDRRASFVCVLAFLDDAGLHTFEGKTDGEITTTEVGNRDFCYDCLFFSHDLGKVFGEVTEQEKNSVSHRSRAIEKLKAYLKQKK